MAITKSIGMIVLAVYLILVGLTSLITGFAFPGQAIVMGILALVAGILILLGK